MPDLITCGHCKGTGKVEFNGAHADTLILLRHQKKEVTGTELAKITGCKGTAMNNRLAMLEKHGLATSRRYGRERLYKAVKK